MSRLRLPLLSLLVVPFVGGFAGPAQGADQWTSLNGSASVPGEMLGLWNGRVLLKLDGGRRIAVRMDDLRADSRILAEKRLEELNQRMRERREEIRIVADEAAAPAPKDQPALPQPPSYQMPGAGTDLASSLAAARDQLAAGHLRVVYDTLPPSHQQQVDAVATAAFAKLDAGSFESTRTTFAGLADLVISRQRWLFSHPRFAQLSDEQQASLLTAAQLIAAITSEDVLNLQTLRSRPFSESVASISDALAPYLHQFLSGSGGMIGLVEFEVTAGGRGGMVANTKLPVLGTIDSRPFIQIEGRWVQGDNPETAGGGLNELLRATQALPDGSLRLPSDTEAIVQQISAAVSTLGQAPSRRDFHRQLDEVLPQLAIAISQWSGFKLPGTGYPGYAGGSEMVESTEAYSTDTEMSTSTAEP